MKRRLDNRFAVISAVILATLVFGYIVHRSGVEVGRSELAEADPHRRDDATLERGDADLHQAFQQAVALLQAGEFAYAVKGFHDVLRIAPEMPEAHVNMGFALLGLEKYREARDFFRAAIDLRPSQLNAYYGIAMAHEGLGELRYAVNAMQTYVHLAEGGDPFRRKGESAIWEWEAAIAAEKQ